VRQVGESAQCMRWNLWPFTVFICRAWGKPRNTFFGYQSQYSLKSKPELYVPNHQLNSHHGYRMVWGLSLDLFHSNSVKCQVTRRQFRLFLQRLERGSAGYIVRGNIQELTQRKIYYEGTEAQWKIKIFDFRLVIYGWNYAGRNTCVCVI